jgi:hypothetical protein
MYGLPANAPTFPKQQSSTERPQRTGCPAFAGHDRGECGTAQSRHTVSLLHAQRDKPQLAVGIRHQQQHRLLAVLLELVDPLLDVGSV